MDHADFDDLVELGELFDDGVIDLAFHINEVVADLAVALVAERSDVHAFSTEKAMESERVREAINRHIARINRKLNHWEQIRKWTLIGDELTIESGLLTPTLKIRRTAAEKRYAEEIEKMYEN